MLGLNKTSVILVLGVAIVGLFLSGTLSLATDVGVSDADACAAVEQHASSAVARLTASGFPHATSDPVETYGLSRSGEAKALVTIDWQHATAHCESMDKPVSVTAFVDLTPKAYAALVGEIQNVLATGHTSGHPGNYVVILAGSDIHVPQHPENERAYKWSVAWWATGAAAHGSAA